jgi:hypothetical protein
MVGTLMRTARSRTLLIVGAVLAGVAGVTVPAVLAATANATPARPGTAPHAAVAMAAGTAGSGGAAGSVGTTPASYGSYVSLGDSYAAGPLIPTQTGGLCFRSTRNYASLLTRELHIGRHADDSCSGAETGDMTTGQTDLGLTINAPQFAALSPATQLVTVGIGGNDIGFTDIIVTCAALSVTDPWGAPCKGHYTAGGHDQLAAAVAATAPKVAAVLAGIQQRAPHARVLVVGYPDLLPTHGSGCWPRVPIAGGDVRYLDGVERELNAMLANAATAHGATYVDTYASSVGHDMCQPTGTRWIEGIVPTHPAFPVHPNELGMVNDEHDILAALGR